MKLAVVQDSASADAEHLERIRRGEPAGAAALFEKYSVPLLRFTGRMMQNRADAEEITQDVFLKMIARVDQFDGSAPVASWLFAIAANACRDRMRRGKRAGSVPLEAVAEPRDASLPVESRLMDAEKRRAVRQALSLLSGEQREALILARYHGMPYAEIARTLKISEGAVKTRIFRAMETLKARFTEGDTAWNAATSS